MITKKVYDNEVIKLVKRIDKIYDFKNDFMFKHSLGNDQDPGSFYLLKLFIEGILNISCKSITILNPDLVVENIEDKDMLLDIRVQTNTGDYVNIEMQYSAFSKNQYQRFQIYGASLLSRQEKEGDDYQKNINHVYQIIFIDDIDKANLKLYDCYESRNEEGKLEKYNLLTRVYVQMPYINLIKKQKKLEEFSEIKKGIYIFENGITDDIIRLKEDNKVVEIMKEKIERFNQIIIRNTLNTIDDADAYEVRALYDEWKPDTYYEVGNRRQYDDNLYKCKQTHTSQSQYTLDLIPALWDIIAPDDPDLGTIDNPIPVPENFSSMVYVKGKYYLEDGVIYLMNSAQLEDGEEISLTYKPSALVGIYFKVVENKEEN